MVAPSSSPTSVIQELQNSLREMNKIVKALDNLMVVLDLIFLGMCITRIDEGCSYVMVAIWVFIAFLAHIRLKQKRKNDIHRN